MLTKSDSAEDTLAWGERLGKTLLPGTILALQGDLGAGKTSLVKGISRGALGVDPREVTSPTFTYLNIYTSGELSLYHFDLYRLNTHTDFLGLGFDEYFHSGGICCIEWPEKILSLLPAGTRFIHLSYLEENQRLIHEKN